MYVSIPGSEAKPRSISVSFLVFFCTLACAAATRPIGACGGSKRAQSRPAANEPGQKPIVRKISCEFAQMRKTFFGNSLVRDGPIFAKRKPKKFCVNPGEEILLTFFDTCQHKTAIAKISRQTLILRKKRILFSPRFVCMYVRLFVCSRFTNPL